MFMVNNVIYGVFTGGRPLSIPGGAAFQHTEGKRFEEPLQRERESRCITYIQRGVIEESELGARGDGAGD